MADDPNTKDTVPSLEGRPIPCAPDSYGVHVKLATYALDPTNQVAASKVRGFERILGITIEDIDYLEGAVYTGIQLAPVVEVRDNPPWGIKCIVKIPVRGRGQKQGRLVDVTTSWEISSTGAAPRLVTIFPTS